MVGFGVGIEKYSSGGGCRKEVLGGSLKELFIGV